MRTAISEHRTQWPLYGRGATAYEFQWRRFGLRVVHLCGGRWGAWWFKPWQRLSFQWFSPGPDYSAEHAKHWPRRS